jgi:hypothetical protein
MRRHARNQLVLNLDRQEKPIFPATAPEGLLQALADLLLEALDKENKTIASDQETCDAAKNLT